MVKKIKLAARTSDTQNNDKNNSRTDAPKPDKNNFSADELISTLQNQRENQRARQVFEWENTRRNNNFNFS